MDFNDLNLPRDMSESLEELYKSAKILNPKITTNLFIEGIIGEWLRPYKIARENKVYQKGSVVLRNNLRQAIKLCGKTQSQLSRETKIDRAYLGQIINGRYDPSVTVALILMYAMGYPPEKFIELFFLEPAITE